MRRAVGQPGPFKGRPGFGRIATAFGDIVHLAARLAARGV